MHQDTNIRRTSKGTKRMASVLLSLALISAGSAWLLANACTVEQRLTCGANLKAFAQAIRVYGADLAAQSDGQRHAATSLLVDRGCLDNRTTKCPFSGKKYVIASIPDRNDRDHEQVFAYEPASNHGGGNVAYTDGHVEFLNKDAHRQVLIAAEHD